MSFQSALGNLFTHFYSKEELSVLESEIIQKTSSWSQEKDFVSLAYTPGSQDPLLRLQHVCFLAKFPSLPFFTAKIRKTIAEYKLEVNRSIHYHPEPGFELIYWESPLETLPLYEDLRKLWKADYGKIISFIHSFQDFLKEDPSSHFANNLDQKLLLEWLLHKGLVWEGAIFQSDQERKEWGEIPLSEMRIWFSELESNNQSFEFIARSHSEKAYLGEGKLFSFLFFQGSKKLLLVGSVNEYAKGQALTDIPWFRKKFQDFLTEKGIEAQSGLGRSSRMMFNYLPTELVFLVPPSSYPVLHTALLEQNFRNSLGSVSLLLQKGMGLIAVFVPESQWEEPLWREQKKSILQFFPQAEIRQYEVLRGNVMEAFLLCLHPDVSENQLFDFASRMELAFRPWEIILAQKWEERSESLAFLQSLRFSDNYKSTHSPEQAIQDLSQFKLQKHLGLCLYFSNQSGGIVAHAILPSKSVGLSQWLQIWNEMNLFPDNQSVYQWFEEDQALDKVEFSFSYPSTDPETFAKWIELVRLTLQGKIALDPFHSLSVKKGLHANQIFFLVAIRDYLLQNNPLWNPSEVNRTFLLYSDILAKGYERFQSLFLEGKNSGKEDLVLASQIGKTSREDEILKAFASVIESIVRTSFFGTQKDSRIGFERDSVAFKLNSSQIISLPSPKPFREIFVYSPSFQGIHLRGGKVSRGGLRFSDRPSDYRTELLSLWKTQTVKNSLIVPVGSKGCFVLTPHAFQTKPFPMVEAYKGYIRGLLSVTDSYSGTSRSPFAGVNGLPYDYDDFDPYLVVAADKGTAALSDTANAISLENNFWLGDAFASGGSRGYSHKEFGITAKGALVTADRNLRSLGKDFKKEITTVVGIGDMGGDVFGNGLIESPFFHLVAAFNHKHIFLDPNPQLELSYEERKRLFFGPGSESGWDFYNPKLISKGGGVFLRNEKQIPISPEVKAILGIEEDYLSGPRLISAILRAPVDLLYNGGIGTYIKGSSEDDIAVGDPTNNEVRIKASEVRARVISEGGNLGLTHTARLELDERGILLFTDALDNSAGVDLSDHEVNLKILCAVLENSGSLAAEKRDALLKEVALEVARKVLLDNATQSLAVSVDRMESESGNVYAFKEVLDRLQSWGKIQPREQGIPLSKEVWDNWDTKGVPRPILCILLSHVKMALYDLSLEAKLFSPVEFPSVYETYFPVPFRELFQRELYEHTLKEEIVTTRIVNFYVDLLGSRGITLLPPNKEIALQKFKRIVSFLLHSQLPAFLYEVADVREVPYEIGIRESVHAVRERIRLEFQESLPLGQMPAFLDKFLSPNTWESLRRLLQS